MLDVHHESVSSRINPEITLAIWKLRGEKRKKKKKKEQEENDAKILLKTKMEVTKRVVGA